MASAYDEIGHGYSKVRHPDPRIATKIHAALGEARTILNVGAGAGSYEPTDRELIAVEPSAEMIAQRPAGSAPVVQAIAEELPFADNSFDAVMAVSTIHHWPDLEAGLAELRRVARKRIALVTFDPEILAGLWIFGDYFPGMLRSEWTCSSSGRLAVELPASTCSRLMVPRDCSDHFFAALWGRPELFLEPAVVQPMWVWQLLPEEARRKGRDKLAADLENGVWDERYGYLRATPELDVGLRLVVSELS